MDTDKGKNSAASPSSGLPIRVNLRSSVVSPVVALAAVLLLFAALEFFIPIRTTVQIGADEGFELAKATLCLNGYKLYSDVWCDHPPLHTSLITEAVKYINSSVAGPRLVTIGFAALLIASVFLIAFRLGSLTVVGHGVLTAPPPHSDRIGLGAVRTPRPTINESGLLCGVITTVLLIASPGFLELSSSCMMEIPALAPAVTALCVLFWNGSRSWYIGPVIAGLLFGISLEMKILGLLLYPVAALVLWTQLEFPRAVRSMLILGATSVLTLVGLDLVIDKGAFMMNFHQSWMSHFAPTVSSEYGSPSDHRFPFTLLIKNWDMTLPAVIGIVWLVRRSRKTRSALVPLGWLGLVLIAFVTHKPWWSYYYVHIAIPLCLCAGFGLARVMELSVPFASRTSNRAVEATVHAASRKFVNSRLRRRWVITMILPASAYALFALLWIGSRAYLEISEIRKSPQTYYSLVLTEIDRFKPFTKWIYTDNLTYSFYSRIPVPPQLAVVSLKRLWPGEITVAAIADDVRKYKPELIALRNDTRELPFQELLNTEYRLVYQDAENRLYAHRSIANQPDMAAAKE